MAVPPVAALMSIRQPFADLILAGEKTVELRRVPMKRNITHVIIYESAGMGRIVGYFDVSNITQGAPADVWKQYQKATGLSKQEFDDYFCGCNVAVAIGVGRVVRLKVPRPLSDFRVERPPQSFMYLCANSLALLS